MHNHISLIAKIFVYLMGLAVVSVLVILLPELAREEAVENPAATNSALPYLIFAWLLAVPIFVALFQALKLISYVADDGSVSAKAVSALKIIKICAAIFGIAITLGVIVVIILAKGSNPAEDITFVIALGFVFTFTASIVATSAAVLQRLVQNAIDIKAENESMI